MRLSGNLLLLPSSLLVLLFTSPSSSTTHHNEETPISHANFSTPSWPYNLPPHVKYWPEDPSYRRRDLEAVQTLLGSGHVPIAVKKMGVDESEKFWPHYWGFEEIQHLSHPGSADFDGGNSIRKDYEQEKNQLLFNSSKTINVTPPFALHADFDEAPASLLDRRRGAADALAILQRGFQCPSGTSSCSGIGYPNSCCATGETCVVITDTGLGPVGCCESGSNCGGTISTCAADSTACPDSLGGGCCISGYTCSGVGCVRQVVVTITTTHVVKASSSTLTEVLTTTLTSSQISTTNTDTSLQTTLSCATNYHACPVNIGGGCCPTGRLCTTGMVCPLSPGATTSPTSTKTPTSETTTTTTATPSAPARPTSVVDPVTTSASTSTVISGACPTGFYACSAFYAGGCCRTGRDCATTDCPATASTTLISAGETIVVPLTGSATTTASDSAGTGGSCASGWSSCAASFGGNCCPTGFACGSESCSSVGATSTVTTSKEAVGATSATNATSAGVGIRELLSGRCVGMKLLVMGVAAAFLL